MVDLETEAAGFVPTTRPVRRMVAAIAVIGLVCTVLWWLGAVGPRVTAVVRSIDADTTTGRGTMHVEVRNEGRLPIEVRGVSLDSRGGPAVDLGTVLVDGRQPAADGTVRITSGQVARIDVAYVTDCRRGIAGYGSDPTLGLRVKAPLGVTQTRPVGTIGLYEALTGGDGSVDPGPLLCPSAEVGGDGGAPVPR